MNDILDMTLVDFNGVLEAFSDRSDEISGKGRLKPLKDSQKEMIKRSKEKLVVDK